MVYLGVDGHVHAHVQLSQREDCVAELLRQLLRFKDWIREDGPEESDADSREDLG